jgi:hypothetical protein
MKEKRAADPSQFILPSESWKEKVVRPIEKRPSKFQRLFDTEMRKRIEKALALDALGSLVVCP